MPQMFDAGPRVAAAAPGVSSLSFQPPFDREHILYRILILAPSAVDTWTVTVGGLEVMRFYVDTVGNNQLPGGKRGNTYRNRDIFTYYHQAYGDYFTIPIPRGMQCTVASVGGATADVILFGIDVTPGTITTAMTNHYQGSNFLMPLTGYLAAAVTATGETSFDTAVRPSWVPDIFTGKSMTPGFNIDVIAMFIEGVSVNTYSGSANHVSSTDHLGIQRNGERLFSHELPGMISGGAGGVTTVASGQLVTPGGIPNLVAAAAAGSANTVYSQDTSVYPAFQNLSAEVQNMIDPPLRFRAGDLVQFYQGITGDITGSPSYAHASVVCLAKVTKTGSINVAGF